MPFQGDRRHPRGRILLLIVAFLITVVSFGGPLAAYAAPTPSGSDTATPDAKKDDQAATADKTPADEQTATPAETPSETPSPEADDQQTAQPSATPSKDQASEEPTSTPAPSESIDDPSAEPTTTETPTPTPSAKADKKASEDGGVTTQVIPPATGNNAVITVKVGGNRTTQTAVGNLAGVQLGLYTTADGTTPVAGFGTCTSDGDGDCSFIVPNTQPNGANRDRRFWVKQIATAAGYYQNTQLGTGSATGSANATDYEFQTGTQLQNGQTYTSTANFMIGTGATNDTASGGIWQNSLNNPVLPAKCGVNVAVVLDLSTSVGGDLPNLKAAANTFVNALTGTPSAVSVFTFGTNAPASGTQNTTLPLTSVSTSGGTSTVTSKINGLAINGTQYTNWDAGFYQVAQSPSNFDVAVIITDGNPSTYTGGPTGTRTRFREVENGIFSANAIKAEGTRVIAFGVGSGISSAGGGLNLKSISGPTLNSDYYQSADYAAAGAQLKTLALGSCQGSVTVVKQVVPSTTATGTTTGAQPQDGWTFTGTGSTGITVNAPTSRITGAAAGAAGTGAANFPLTFAGGTNSGNVTFVETAQPGYTLHQGVANQNAVCRNISTGANIVPTNTTGGFVVAADRTYPISCTVYNKAPTPLASVIVNKSWRINGTDYPEGNQPTNFVAGLTIAGTGQGWGVERTGFRLGDQPILNESISNVPIQCTVTSRQVVLANGASISQSLPYTPTLITGQNTYTIRNVVDCQTKLTLTKTVEGGSEPLTSWTLDAVAPAGAAAGPNGTSGSAGASGAAVSPGVTYPLAEAGTTTGALNYTQFVAPNAVLLPGSTGSWTCQEVGTDGTTVIPGFSDGLNGGVTVPLGKWVGCNAVNRTATLVLRKVVQNTHGGTAGPANWQLTATPTGTFPAGLPSQTVTGSTVGSSFNVRPGVVYRLTESGGPSGYSLESDICDVIPGNTRVDNLSLNPLDTGACTFTNVDTPAALTLIKTVTNDNGGTATAGRWTLAATGPTNISGATNSTAVTNAAVDAGTYTLSESGGPAGYTASAWSCTGVANTGTTLVLTLGSSATCTINNNDQPAMLTLVKTVTNNNGGTALPVAWTLSASGPTSISGVSGSGPVTAAQVNAGTYALAEANGPAGYAAGSWSCSAGTLTGSSLVLTNGVSATCTIDNDDQPGHLTLVKTVINDNGGTATENQWTLTATGPTTITGATGSPAVTNAQVNAGRYALSESGPAGYTASSWSCTGATATGDTVVVPLNTNVSCVVTNDDQPATLSLVKVVDNGLTGATHVPADWTLTAGGPTPVAGAGNSAAVTDQTVDAGTYALAESGGPSGYTASSWACTGGTLTGRSVVVPSGGDVSCTITNTAQQPHLTLVKVVDNASTGGTAVPADWTLSAVNGGTLVSGPGNSAAVTDQAVGVGDWVLSESGGPVGYTDGTWSCVGGAAFAASTVTMAPGSDAICTITNTAQQSRLTLVKNVNNDNGGTASPNAWTLAATGPTTGVIGSSGATSVTSVPVSPGTYGLAESGGPTGYTAGDWSCTDGSLTGADLTLGLGEDAVCTIENDDQPATLTLVKTATNNNGGTAQPIEWTLSAVGPTTISGATGSGPVTGAPVSAGSYDLGEADGPAGYAAGAWSCSGGTLSGSTLVLGNGTSAVCTIVNDDQPATLTLVKSVINDNGGTAQPTQWTLSATGPTTISGASGSTPVTGAPVSAGSYDLGEADGPAGYTAGAWSCSGGTLSGSTLVLGNGTSAVCTVVNDDQPATLTLVKTVDNGNTGATYGPGDWTLAASGPTNVSGAGDSPDVIAQTVDAGNYSLTESGGPAGYVASAWSCTGAAVNISTVAVPSGGAVRCTITNTVVQPRLTLVKQVVNTGGGTAVPADWTLTATGPEVTVSGPGNSADVTDQDVQVGTYTLSESGGPAGFTPSEWICTGATGASPTSVTIGPGSDATCTIVNSAVPASLTLIKEVVNGTTGADTQAAAWRLTAAGPSTISGPTGTSAEALPGTYALSEDGPGGYDSSGWTCTGAAGRTAGSVTIALGNNAVCSITNTARQPRLTLVKDVVNDNGGTARPTDWTLSADGPTPISGATGDPAVTDAPVQIGTYALDENALLTGYTRGDWSCDAGTLDGDSLGVALGDDVTCTIVNNDQPAQLTLRKHVSNPDPTGGTAGPTDWTLSADGPSPIRGATGDASITDAVVDAGSYTLSETDGPDGYSAGSWTCGNGAQVVGNVVTVPNGGDVTCDIVNTARQPLLTLVKTVTNDNGGTAVPTDWTLSAAGPTQGVIGRVGDTEVTDVPVQAGDYRLAEGNGPTGYRPGEWSCDGGSLSDSTLSIELGDDITCTIDNDDQPARLTLVKSVDHNGSGDTTPATSWILSANGPSAISGTTGSAAVTGAAVDAGNYNLAETGPVGHTASAWDCGGATIAGATVTLPIGADVTCTVLNTAIAPTLTLVKTVDNRSTGATHTADEWALTAEGPNQLITVTTGVTTSAQVGTYDLSESGPEGYAASGWVCSGASTSTTSSVTLVLNDAATCTITNAAQQPTLTLVKTVTNDDGGTAEPTDWTLTADGPTGGVSGRVGDSTVTDVPVAIGDYDLTEAAGPTGYRPGAWNCVGGSLSGSTVSIALGDHVTCTIDNDDILGTWDLSKTSDPVSGSTVLPGDTITYTVTATKTGGVNPVNRVVSDDLSNVLDHATLVGAPTASTGTASITGTSLTWVIPSLGGTETVTYTVRVNPDAYGVTFDNVVSGAGSDTCPPANPGQQCKTTQFTPHSTLRKVSNPVSGTTVAPGTSITYTLTMHNDSDGVVSGAVVTDDLSDVLNNAILGTIGAGGSVTDDTLTWTVATLQPGQSVSLSYVVTVKAGAYGKVLRNVATPGPGGDCVTPSDCITSNPTPHYTVTKESDPARGSTVRPGDPITYTLRAYNNSEGVVSGAVVTDDLADVLDNASLGDVGSGGSVTGTTLTWTVPELQPRGEATLRYQVTVDDGQWGVTLRNVATPGPGGDCTEPGACTTRHFTPRWLLAKSSDPASGSTVTTGSQVTYTLTARNVSEAVVAGAVATDELSDVLDNASLDAVPDGATVSGTKLSWALPTLQPGDLVTLSYTVTIDDDAINQTLRNVATPGRGGECVPAADPENLRQAAAVAAVDVSAVADPEVCSTIHYTPEWTLSKVSDPASGSTVRPGDTVSYTLTATNVSKGVVSGAVATDDLSAVLAHATVKAPLPADAALTGTTLTWQVPTLDSGDTATLTYRVTLDDDAWDTSITNVVTPDEDGRCVASCTTNHDTPPKPNEPNLPNTGGPALAVVGIGLALLIGGGGLMLWTRRRRVQ